MKNQDLQALGQIGSILAGLGPDSYIAAALKRSFGTPQPDRAAPRKAPALTDVQVLADALWWQYEDCRPVITDWKLNRADRSFNQKEF